VSSGDFALGRDVVELEGDDVTLRELLMELSQSGEDGVNFVDPRTGDICGPFVVRLNGEIHNFLPHHLDTRLEDGDYVEITMSMVGGG